MEPLQSISNLIVKHIESKNTCGVARWENSLVPGISVYFQIFFNFNDLNIICMYFNLDQLEVTSILKKEELIKC